VKFVSNRRLLLADDSVTIRKVIDLTFADEGIDVVAVADGDSAIDRVSDSRPDLVLADVHMPGLDGYQVCELIKSNADTKEIPVVLLVGSFEPFDEAEAARVGADAHLTKPFQSIKVLVDTVSELMYRAGATADDSGAIEKVDAAVSFAGQEPDAQVSAAPQRPENRTADTSDIDSLVAASFAETVKIPDPDETDTLEYVDAGMDDEMIETTFADDPLTGTANGNGAQGEKADIAFESGDEFAAMQTVPLNTPIAPVRQSPFESIAEPDERSGTPIYDSDPFTGFETNPGTMETTLEDIDLLEIPPADSRDSQATTTPELAAHADGTQLVSISPELMEIIVQKVVERLSEKE
jgi:CheY-like chemotaxis protein